MAIKKLVVMTTLPGGNEQTGVSPRTNEPAGSYTSRPYGEFSRLARALFLLNVSAISGAPTLDVVIEGKDEAAGLDVWRTVATFPQQTAMSPAGGVTPIAVDPLYYTILRARWTVGGTGTPTVTFTLSARGVSEVPIVR